MHHALKKTRLALYRRFDQISSPAHFFQLQVRLAKQIIKTETAIQNGGDKNALGYHLDRLYGIGDALAWSVISRFTIRQLGYYESVRTSLIGQKANYLETLEKFRYTAKRQIFVFVDLTRCVTIGDVIEVYGAEEIRIIELKTTAPTIPAAAELLVGRTGRQFSKNFWLTRFLATGFETLYGGTKPTRTIELKAEPLYHHQLLEPLIRDCLEKRASFQLAEPGLFYIASYVDDALPSWLKEKILALNFQESVLAGTGRLIEEDRETAYHEPFLTQALPLELRIPVQEVDINITGILDVNYMQQEFSKRGLKLSYKKEALHIENLGKLFKLHDRFLNDILINFQTVGSLADFIAELFAQPLITQKELTPEETEQTAKRPKDLQSFKKMLEEEYVTVHFSGKKIIAAYTMKGEMIDLKKL